MKREIKYNNYTVILIKDDFGSNQVHFDYNGSLAVTNFGLKQAFELFDFISDEVIKFAKETGNTRFFTAGATDDELITSQVAKIKESFDYEYIETFFFDYFDWNYQGNGIYSNDNGDTIDCENNMFHFQAYILNTYFAYENIGFAFNNVKTKADQRLKLYARMIEKKGGEIERFEVKNNFLSFNVKI